MHIARVHEGRKVSLPCPFCNKNVVSLQWHLEQYHKDQGRSRIEVFYILASVKSNQPYYPNNFIIIISIYFGSKWHHKKHRQAIWYKKKKH